MVQPPASRTPDSCFNCLSTRVCRRDEELQYGVLHPHRPFITCQECAALITFLHDAITSFYLWVRETQEEM